MSATQTTLVNKRFKASPANKARRRVVGALAYGFTGLCTLAALGLLIYLLLFLIIQGAGAINWDFLTKESAAVGEEGGGIISSLSGTAMIVSIAAILGVPIGMLIGIYL